MNESRPCRLTTDLLGSTKRLEASLVGRRITAANLRMGGIALRFEDGDFLIGIAFDDMSDEVYVDWDSLPEPETLVHIGVATTEEIKAAYLDSQHKRLKELRLEASEIEMDILRQTTEEIS